MDWSKEFPRQQFLELVSSGLTEDEALARINDARQTHQNGRRSVFVPGVLVQLQVKYPEFREAVEDAKRKRADVWFNDIIQSTRKANDKDQVPDAKLKFEQRKYLAAIDNPEKYSEKIRHDHDVKVSVFQEMKNLKASDVQKMIRQNDPFAQAVEAEYSMVDESDTDLEELLG